MHEITVALHVRGLTAEDLVHCGWSGGPGHVESMAENMADEQFAYLAVCTERDLPVGVGAVRFDVDPEYGELTQLAVFPALQSHGIGEVLITALEAEIARRGRGVSELGVEVANPRARALYERLGYEVRGEYDTGWDVVGEDGEKVFYAARCLRMRKGVAAPAPESDSPPSL